MLQEKYLKQVIPAMKAKFGYKNSLEVPKIEKVVLNIGLNRALTEKNPKFREQVKETIVEITGQRPVEVGARQSIAGFKIRKGMVVGLKVTLRRNRMYDFVEKLIKIALPRTRDFRGISQKAVDEGGNLSIGLKEQIVFPEIKADQVALIHPLEVTVVTTTSKREEGLELLKLLGVPFKE